MSASQLFADDKWCFFYISEKLEVNEFHPTWFFKWKETGKRKRKKAKQLRLQLA